jgi:1-deoxy-D-xylulose-5-phosphate reductoisomerase
VDSATMMNKGFEVIEAHYLFDIPVKNIETVLHPESYVHSIVEFMDHSMIAQISDHDMRLPIQYALFYPIRKPAMIPSLDLGKIGKLTFEPMDLKRFPCLGYAYKAIEQGGIMPCVMNAANEAAVGLSLDHRIAFLDIETLIEEQMNKAINILHPTLEQLLETDRLVKADIHQNILK